MNVVLTTQWKEQLVSGQLDLSKREYMLRIGFQPIPGTPLVALMLELVDDGGNVAGRLLTQGLGIDDTITFADIRKLFEVRVG